MNHSEHSAFPPPLSTTPDTLREALLSEYEAYLEVSRVVGWREGVFGIQNGYW